MGVLNECSRRRFKQRPILIKLLFLAEMVPEDLVPNDLVIRFKLLLSDWGSQRRLQNLLCCLRNESIVF